MTTDREDIYDDEEPQRRLRRVQLVKLLGDEAAGSQSAYHYALTVVGLAAVAYEQAAGEDVSTSLEGMAKALLSASMDLGDLSIVAERLAAPEEGSSDG